MEAAGFWEVIGMGVGMERQSGIGNSFFSSFTLIKKSPGPW